MYVCLRKGVAAHAEEEMAVLVWDNEADAQAWCDSRKNGWHPIRTIAAPPRTEKCRRCKKDVPFGTLNDAMLCAECDTG